MKMTVDMPALYVHTVICKFCWERVSEHMEWTFMVRLPAILNWAADIKVLNMIYLFYDTAQVKVLLLQKKCMSLQSQVKSLGMLRNPLIQIWMKMLGKMVAAFDVVSYALYNSRATKLKFQGVTIVRSP